jgi:hypothetical protein
LAAPEASAGEAAVLLPGGPAAWAAAAEPRRAAEVAARDEAAVRRPEAAAWVAAAGPLQAAAEVRVAVAEPRQAAEEAQDAAGAAGLLRAAPGARAAALPSGAPWVFRRDQAPPSPAPQPLARSVRAMARPQAASPSKRLWQAARDEGVS